MNQSEMTSFRWKSWIAMLIILVSGYSQPILVHAQVNELSQADKRIFRKSVRLMKKKHHQEAYDNFGSVYRNTPDILELKMKYAECCFYLGKYEEALRYLGEADNLISGYIPLATPSKINKYRRMQETIASWIEHCKGIALREEKPVQVTPETVIIPATDRLEKQLTGNQISIDNERETITDRNQQLQFKALHKNPTSLTNYYIHRQDSTWSVPSEKELRILLQTLISQGLYNKTFLVQYSSGFAEIVPFLTADSQFKQGTEKYNCLKVEQGVISGIEKENIDAVIVILRKEMNH